MRKKRIVIIACSVFVVAAVAIGIVYRTWWSKPERRLDAAEALRHVQLDAPRQPVPQDLLELNAKRKAIGLQEIGEDWAVAPTGMVIMDGPSLYVLVDGHGTPAKVILWAHGGWGGNVSVARMRQEIQEYEVRDGRIDGLAVRWVTNELLLERTENYQDARLVSANYYSPEGKVIASCTFRRQKRWEGRYLQRFHPAFSSGGLDVSYRRGRQHGEAWKYAKDKKPVHMRTFKDGVLDGPSRFYNDDGTLAHEYSYVDGVARRHRNWYPNGQLHSEIERDAKGHQVGPKRQWSPDGTPITTK
jgi:antitoxin component YwqK of YwqJK toxin-antitoxin module